MRDEDPLPISTPSTIYSSSTLISNKKETLDSSIFRRGRYRFWALAAIILLAFWSMLTGTATLRLSVGNLNRLSDEIAGATPIYDDFDVLEIEEREKVVKHMWDVYINSRRIKLPRFWQEAFVAAYEDLTSDAPEVREAAISEIAKMSLHSIDIDPPPLQSTMQANGCVNKQLQQQFILVQNNHLSNSLLNDSFGLNLQESSLRQAQKLKGDLPWK